jgi:hypothetical protein
MHPLHTLCTEALSLNGAQPETRGDMTSPGASWRVSLTLVSECRCLCCFLSAEFVVDMCEFSCKSTVSLHGSCGMTRPYSKDLWGNNLES